MRIALAPVEPHACGGCTLCCKVLQIVELLKPAGQWCAHARKGIGCVLHDVEPDPRPACCETFKCLWLASPEMPDALRPDKVHGVLLPTDDGKGLALHEDPGYPRHARTVLRPVIDAFIADGEHYVVVCSGAARTFIGDLRLLPADARALVPESIRVLL